MSSTKISTGKAILNCAIWAALVVCVYFSVGIPGMARPAVAVSLAPGAKAPEIDRELAKVPIETATLACG